MAGIVTAGNVTAHILAAGDVMVHKGT